MTTTENSDLATVKDFLATARVVEVRNTSQGTKIVLGKDSTDITIRRGIDRRWRYGYISTYGNGSFISGPIPKIGLFAEGYDASGYVIADPSIVRLLDAILLVRGIR